MDVIGSFMTRDAFVADTFESTKSVTLVESSQREVVTDSPGVDFTSRRFTLHGHLWSPVRRFSFEEIWPNKTCRVLGSR